MNRRCLLCLVIALAAPPALAQEKAKPSSEGAKAAAVRAWLKPFKEARKKHEEALKKAKSEGPREATLARLAWAAALEAEARRAAELEDAGGDLKEAATRQRRAVQCERLRLLCFLESGPRDSIETRDLDARRRELLQAMDKDPGLRAHARRLYLREVRGREPERYKALLDETLARYPRIATKNGPALELKSLKGAPALLWFWSSRRPRSLDGAREAAAAMVKAKGALLLIALEGAAPDIEGARALVLADQALIRDLVIDAPPLRLLLDAEGRVKDVDPGPVRLTRALNELAKAGKGE